MLGEARPGQAGEAQKCVPFPAGQGHGVGSPGELGSLASCPLILRNAVLVPAPEKSCAGHSAESSKTCSRCCYAMARQLPGVSYRPQPWGSIAPSLGGREMRACRELWLWNQKRWWEEGDRKSTALQGPGLEDPKSEGDTALSSQRSQVQSGAGKTDVHMKQTDDPFKH